MKSVKKEENKDIIFPILMKSSAGKVVLFTNYFNGITLYDPNNVNGDSIGLFSSNWDSVSQSSIWTKFEGIIELSND